MKVLDRIVEVLPSPYAVDADAMLTQLLDAFALELEAVQEDLDRLRRTHWAGLAYRLTELARLGRLFGAELLPGEGLQSFRARLRALVRARLAGAVGPNEIRLFVYEYLSGAERALGSTFVPGLALFEQEQAFRTQDEHPAYRPLELVENPGRLRRSRSLAALGGRVPYLHRFQERNDGLMDTVVTVAITGFPSGRTAVPLVVNTTTGDLVGYAGVLGVGRQLTLEPLDEPGARAVRALLDGTYDVTERVFSVSGFEPGVPFSPEDLDPDPLLPRLARGANDLVYLSVGLFDVRSLDHIFYAIADDELREGVYNTTSFDHALFPSGPVAHLELAWTELEPASFEVRVPRGIVVEAPELGGLPEGLAHELIARVLAATVQEIRAAGVRAAVHLEPFREEQVQRVRATVPWVVVPGEHGSPGGGEEVALGARFDEAALGIGRLE
jgi:hypothetical protein